MSPDYTAVYEAALRAARCAQAEGIWIVDAAIDAITELCGDLPEDQRYEWIGRILTDLREAGLNQPRLN
ncbi:hypothetical protein I3U63_22915 [Mycobacteroides abscessus subsp. massiliense]|uniref:hypothetical protein n=1 Tax=Mycobacteroides abscessus TaxID=36809 RepID=UPI0019CF59A7|nr:hypothetical protein [Mycobacteroides abscessus]MBN7324368.1 hypothetical protein [Mycobacteroides abscessus subsp. massiliense]